MKVCLVTNKSVDEFKKEQSENSEVIAFSFKGIKELNYKKELKGETEELVKIGKLSRESDSIVISGCVSDNYGVKRLSAVIADKGRIVSIADMTSKSLKEEYSSGGGYKIISTSIGKIGVLVGNDLFSPVAVKGMSLFEADIVICVFREVVDFKPSLIARAFSLLYGVPICVCAENFCMACAKGETLFSCPDDAHVHEILTKKTYKEVITRQRGEIFE